MLELNDFQRNIQEKLPGLTMRFEEPMAKHTSFRIGGPCEVMIFPNNPKQLVQVLQLCHLLDTRPAILGAGTNILAPDEGIRGIVICLKDCLGGMEEVGNYCIRIGAGVTMSRAAVFAANLGLSGMEFAHGIPGTVGGGVYMNAGAYGGEIADICIRVDVVDLKGNLRSLDREALQFSYRHSALEETGEIVVQALFQLQPSDSETVRGKMKELMGKRSASQPLDIPSAGSAFKRPMGGYAAALIDQSGLKGYRVGNAAISQKHAGFAVNLGGATAHEVRQLLEDVSNRVYADSGIRLEPEIRIW